MDARAEQAAPAPRRTAVAVGLTIDAVWAALVTLVPILVMLMSRMSTVDLTYHLRAGRSILATGAIPRVDTFTFTAAGRPWLDQQWGAQVLTAVAARADGYAGVAALRAILVGSAFALLFLACRERGATARISTLLSLGGFVVALPALAMRPQLCAVPLFCATLWLLAARARRPRRLWWIPALTVVWVNVHGSFVFAPLLVALCLAGDVAEHRAGLRRTALVGLATIGATLVSPYGVDGWRYVIELSSNATIRTMIVEWAPTSTSTVAGLMFFATALLLAGWFARRAQPTPAVDLVWLGGFFLLTLPAQRGVIWWGLAVPVVTAGLFAARPSPRTSDRAGSAILNLAVVTVLAAGVVAFLPWWRGEPDLLSGAPAGLSSTAMHELAPGSRLLVYQPWGSWFEDAVPSMPVFVDSRIEIYPTEVWDDYDRVSSATDGWEAVLDRWDVDGMVVARTQTDLLRAVAHDPGWRTVYRDDAGRLIVRT